MKQRTLFQRLRASKTGGFSLLESLVAVFLISVVGIIVTEILRKNTLNLFWNQQTRRAAALADMVFEKYDYLATNNFSSLEQFNQSNAVPSSFFATGTDNQGYAGMYITTNTDPPGTDGSRKLTVTITWGLRNPNQVLTLTKYLAPGIGDSGGAPVHVYVLDQNGVGIPGFEVRAAHHYNPAYVNAIGTNEVIGYTDANGYVTLNNVSIDPGVQPMPVYARKPGSDATIPKSDPTYSQGYYASPNNTWNTKTITVSQISPNEVRFDMRNNDFSLLASISGILTNASRPINGMALKLTANGTNGPKVTIDVPGKWTVYSQAITGAYEFNNIAPGLISLAVVGIEGSYPTVPQTPSPPFVQGYVGFGGNGPSPWIYQATLADPPGSLTGYNVAVQPLGSLNLTTVDNLTGNLLPGATVSFVWPDIGFNDRNRTWTGTTDSNGNLQLFNMFAIAGQSVSFSANIAPNGCVSNGSYINKFPQACSPNQVNNVTLRMTSGAAITGIVTDNASPANPLSNMQVSVPGMGGVTMTAVTSADGSFTLCGISPDRTYIPTWPTVKFSLKDLGSHIIGATFSGTISDNDFPSELLSVNVIPQASNPPPAYIHNLACSADPNPGNTASDSILSSTLGQYGPVCVYYPYQGTISQAVTGGPVNYSAGTIVVPISTVSGGLTIQSPYYNIANNTKISIVSGNTYTFNMTPKLIEQSVSGTLTEAGSGTVLAGVPFNPCSGCKSPASGSCQVTTDSHGSYGPVDVCVRGRNGGSEPDHGSVTVTVPDGVTARNTHSVYTAQTHSANIPSPATPDTPIPINFSLIIKGGGI